MFIDTLPICFQTGVEIFEIRETCQNLYRTRAETSTEIELSSFGICHVKMTFTTRKKKKRGV